MLFHFEQVPKSYFVLGSPELRQRARLTRCRLWRRCRRSGTVGAAIIPGAALAQPLALQWPFLKMSTYRQTLSVASNFLEVPRRLHLVQP